MSRATAIVDKLLEAEDDFDPREYLLMPAPSAGRRIRTSYSTYDEESLEAGDALEHGWEDEEGVEMDLDKWDIEDGITVAQKAAKFLKDQGAYEASSSHFGPGIWYSDANNDWDNDGTLTEHSYHLVNFTPEEEQEIFNEVKHI